MADPDATGTTNNEPNTAVEVTADCNVFWSAAQQFAYLRLSEDIQDNKETLEVDLLDSYYARAQRIAATYARFYLETEDGGDPSKKGRYYWMALGAFASKTVGCIFDHPAIKVMFNAGYLTDDNINPYSVDMNVLSEGLGVGNLWLFMDVAPWHWFNNNYEGHFFDGMSCIHERDATKLAKVPKQVTTENLQWANYAVSKINNLKQTDYILEGMKLCKVIENAADINEEGFAKMFHLQAIANHEQEMILQKLIYDNSDFVYWIEKQRGWFISMFAGLLPKYELVFTSGCTTENDKLKSVASEDIELELLGDLEDGEDSKSRMGWIGAAAEKFHGLMSDRDLGKAMESEIRTIASWVNAADGDGNWIHPNSSAFK